MECRDYRERLKKGALKKTKKTFLERKKKKSEIDILEIKNGNLKISSLSLIYTSAHIYCTGIGLLVPSLVSTEPVLDINATYSCFHCKCHMSPFNWPYDMCLASFFFFETNVLSFFAFLLSHFLFCFLRSTLQISMISVKNHIEYCSINCKFP